MISYKPPSYDSILVFYVKSVVGLFNKVLTATDFDHVVRIDVYRMVFSGNVEVERDNYGTVVSDENGVVLEIIRNHLEPRNDVYAGEKFVFALNVLRLLTGVKSATVYLNKVSNNLAVETWEGYHGTVKVVKADNDVVAIGAV